jgi:hypothetical protein
VLVDSGITSGIKYSFSEGSGLNYFLMGSDYNIWYG